MHYTNDKLKKKWSRYSKVIRAEKLELKNSFAEEMWGGFFRADTLCVDLFRYP